MLFPLALPVSEDSEDENPSRIRSRLGHRLWLERLFFSVVLLLLLWVVYRLLFPAQVWAILVDGQPAAFVAGRGTAETVRSYILEAEAGEFAPYARFRQKVTLVAAKSSEGKVVNRWQAQEILSRKLAVVIPASWLTIDDQPLFAMVSQAEIEKCLAQLAQHYQPADTKILGAPRYTQKVVFRDELLSAAQAKRVLLSQKEGLARLLAPAVARTNHVVRLGETASRIAGRYKVSLDDLQAANPDLNLNRLRAGDSIVVAGGRPPLTVSFRARETKAREIPFWTEYIPDSSLAPGEKKVLQKGKPGKQAMISLVTYVNGKETSRIEQADRIITGAKPERVATGLMPGRKPESVGSRPRRHRLSRDSETPDTTVENRKTRSHTDDDLLH
jgi:hypothetical protein